MIFRSLLLFNKSRMAKKTNRKPKIVRSSSMVRTINEGQKYITQFNNQSRRASPLRNEKKLRISKLKTRKEKKQKRTHQLNRLKIPQNISASILTEKLSDLPLPLVPPIVQQNPVISIDPIVPDNSVVSVDPVAVSALLPAPAISRSNSKSLSRSGSKNNQFIQQQLHDRLGKHNATIGKLNFSLRWWDPNDLDLYVTCPCGTKIFYMNKKCLICQGELDIDMNNAINPSLEPVEHIFFNKPKPGLYRFYVRYCGGPKYYRRVQGGQSSKYALSLHEDLNQIFKYEDSVSTKQTEMHYDFMR